VPGYHASGDGGGGEFYWDANGIASDDGGTIFAPAGVPSGRWKRLFSFSLSLQWFGAKADGVRISELTVAGGSDSAKWVGGIFDADDVGKRIAIHAPSSPLAGTVSTDSGSYEIVGNGTAFTTDAFEGQPIVIDGIQYEVVTIKDDTHILINESVSSKAAGLTLYLAPRFSTAIKAVDSVTQQITLAAPVPGTDPQYLTPAAYGTDNSTAIDAAETVAAIKGQQIDWQPGLYLFAETLDRRSGTTWTSSPGVTAPDGSQKGAQLMWAGQVGATGIRYFGTQFTETRGIALFGNLLLKFGVLVDSNNQPASTQNRFCRIAIMECWDSICIGTSDGVTEYQSDGILVQDSMFVNWTRAAIEINSQNAFQNSKIERGVMRQIRPRSACSFIRLSFSPNNFIVEGVTAGTGGSFSGAFIDVRYPVNSGGNYFLVVGCETELFGDIIRTYQDDNSGGGVILMNNAWGGDTMNIGHRFQVVSIANRGFARWSASGGPLCNVRSVGDIVSDPLTQGWHVANGATLWIAPLS
jgi:hypothetical protein